MSASFINFFSLHTFYFSKTVYLKKWLTPRFSFILFAAILFFQLAPAAYSQGKYELKVAIAYNIPILETYGNNIIFDPVNEILTIGGKRIINSDNLGTTFGYGIQVTGSMWLFKSNYIKALGSISYMQLSSKYSLASSGFYYGTRINVFSIATGLQINPIGIHKFYPSVVGLFRFNEIGGESYFHAGLDFFVVSPRFGISTGMDLNYKFNNRVGISLGARYNYDNMLNKQSQEGTYNDAHVINFRDLQSATNGLEHNRRVAYVSILTGINVYFK